MLSNVSGCTENLEALLNEDINEADTNARMVSDISNTGRGSDVCDDQVVTIEDRKNLFWRDIRLAIYVNGRQPTQNASACRLQNFWSQHDSNVGRFGDV